MQQTNERNFRLKEKWDLFVQNKRLSIETNCKENQKLQFLQVDFSPGSFLLVTPFNRILSRE